MTTEPKARLEHARRLLARVDRALENVRALLDQIELSLATAEAEPLAMRRELNDTMRTLGAAFISMGRGIVDMADVAQKRYPKAKIAWSRELMKRRYFIIAPDGEPLPATREAWIEWADHSELDPVDMTEIRPGVWLITAFDGVAPRPYSTARIDENDAENRRGDIIAEYTTREEAAAGHRAIVAAESRRDDLTS